MAREMRFGEEAGRDIIRTVREHVRRMQNQPGTRARNRGTQQSQPPLEVANTDPVYTLAIRGSASAGTITIVATKPGTTATITVNYDDDETDVATSLAGFDASVQTRGGDLRWNAIKIHLSNAEWNLRITAVSLTRETNGVVPKAELSYCPEPSNWWS
jgi:hypothetical protein